MNRREFIGGAAAFGTVGKLAADAPAAALRLGVLSDIHLIAPPNEVTFEHALRWFDGQKADGVVICGDHDTGLNPKTLERIVKEPVRRARESIPENDH